MGTYYVPRNLKGESRILYVFSMKALIYTGIGAGIGLIFLLIFSLCGLTVVGLVILLTLALLGFMIGTFKMPEIRGASATKKIGGEAIDDIIKRFIKFNYDINIINYKKKKKIYTYIDTKEEK